jgi:hypothetical protein
MASFRSVNCEITAVVSQVRLTLVILKIVAKSAIGRAITEREHAAYTAVSTDRFRNMPRKFRFQFIFDIHFSFRYIAYDSQAFHDEERAAVEGDNPVLGVLLGKIECLRNPGDDVIEVIWRDNVKFQSIQGK